MRRREQEKEEAAARAKAERDAIAEEKRLGLAAARLQGVYRGKEAREAYQAERDALISVQAGARGALYLLVLFVQLWVTQIVYKFW